MPSASNGNSASSTMRVAMGHWATDNVRVATARPCWRGGRSPGRSAAFQRTCLLRNAITLRPSSLAIKESPALARSPISRAAQLAADAANQHIQRVESGFKVTGVDVFAVSEREQLAGVVHKPWILAPAR